MKDIETRGTIKDYFESLCRARKEGAILTAEQHAIADLVEENQRLKEEPTTYEYMTEKRGLLTMDQPFDELKEEIKEHYYRKFGAIRPLYPDEIKYKRDKWGNIC